VPKLVTAVVPAAGQGTRLGSNTPKQFLTLGDRPLLAHSLQILASIETIQEIIIAIPDTDQEYCRKEVLQYLSTPKVIRLVPGGARRQDSVRHALDALTNQPDFVLIHDAARPFLTTDMLDRAIQVAIQIGASVVALPMPDTVKYVNGSGMIEHTVNREHLWLAQTPQVFRFDWLLKAHQWAHDQNLDVTDDAALVEQFGFPVSVVPGSSMNLKITRPEDLTLGEIIWKSRHKEHQDTAWSCRTTKQSNTVKT